MISLNGTEVVSVERLKPLTTQTANRMSPRGGLWLCGLVDGSNRPAFGDELVVSP